MKITVTFTYRQADRLRMEAENGAACAHSPKDGREYRQIADKISRAIDAAILASKKSSGRGR